ncbi:flagellin N-terminal helical domain-containing protein [Azohydromonas caseinilytica]|uniref:Flagellin n=1 Tax=Azohydromonas caseinilytica TaxID=2728836 RepID=A0A848F7Z9_9BURK|nr:flagellin [Azohydromonas caseinilytica]NML14886.1 flagellin FliC [Azohydromonas caseinilytica]
MALSINTNVSSLNSQRALSASQGSLQTSMARLSSGLRVNGAKDDAAGLGIADRMNAQARGMTVAIRNANDAISLTQTADAALGKVTDGLQRMRELAVQGANGTNTTADWDNINVEYQALLTEANRAVNSTRFNGEKVFSGTAIKFQVGADNVADDQIDVTVATVDLSAVTGAITSQADAQAALGTIDTALKDLALNRANLGAQQNVFDNVIASLQANVENTTAARGRIMDADFATETSNLSRAQVLQQAGTAMLAQANQSAQNVMQLLR